MMGLQKAVLYYKAIVTSIKKFKSGTSLVVRWLRLQPPKAGGPGLIPGMGTGSHMPPLRVHMLQLRPSAASLCPREKENLGWIQKKPKENSIGYKMS